MAFSNTITSPTKPRSLSDVPKPSLSPSPVIREGDRTTKDDSASASPFTPKRPHFPIRGLSLQLPRESSGPTSNFPTCLPLSPKLDASMTHAGPASVLPRRSRGLEFTRACTNLHHSTLAESSPDTSPTIAGRGFHLPRRKSLCSNSVLGSPSTSNGPTWPIVPHTERNVPSSSVSSINMLDTDHSSSTDSDEHAADCDEIDGSMDKDVDDSIYATPQASKAFATNFMSGSNCSPGAEWMASNVSPAAASLMSFQRARLHKGRSRNSSSSGNSSRPGISDTFSPVMKSIEQPNGHQCPPALIKQQVQSRRESLSLGTGEMQLSDSGEDVKHSDGKDAGSTGTGALSTHSPRGVIRRAVTRRSNLLPKTKTFARIRAALMEEAAPVENEAKREADVIHQVRENDPAAVSPRQGPPSPHSLAELAEDEDLGNSNATSLADSLASSFSREAAKHSDGMRFWDNFEGRHRTSPPSLISCRTGSISNEDMGLGGSTSHPTANSGIGIFAAPSLPGSRSRSRSSTPLASNAPTAGEAARSANNRKRGRDDDLDPVNFKRRAVSPGMSVASSPVLPQSPSFNWDKAWGQMPPPKTSGERSNSTGSSTKRVGMQGMVETNDSLMNMSID